VRLLLSFYRRFLRYRRALFLGYLCIPLAQVSDIAVTVLIGRAIKRIHAEREADFLAGVMVLMAVFALTHAVFRYLQRWLIVVVSRRVENDLKQQLFDKLTSLSFAFHNRSRSGDVVSRVTSDVENLRMFLGPGMMYTVGAAVAVPVSLAVLFTLHAPLASTMLLPMLLMAGVMKAFTPRLHRHSTAVQESLAEISHRAQENFSGIRIVKGYNREDQQARRFVETSGTNRVNQVALARSRGLVHAAIGGANDMTFVVILVVGGLAAIDRTLAVGDLFMFIDLTFKVFWPLIALGWIAGMYPRAIASAERVQELLDESPDVVDAPGAVRKDVRGALELREVGFSYNGAPALSGISVDVPAGSTLGVVGPTGCGKTTLLNLLGRLYDCDGEILVDGTSIRSIALGSLRGALGYVPQDSFLFSETFRENVRFGADGELDDDEIERLVECARMTDEVAAFPNGIDQLIGERGVTLSGGQRQRTCIARALARRPKILVLDDCLSAVDSETEKELVANLRHEGEGRTVVVAAHRLSTVRDADQILVMTERGGVEAIGTHDELIARDGWYRATWRQQQRLEELSEI